VLVLEEMLRLDGQVCIGDTEGVTPDEVEQPVFPQSSSHRGRTTHLPGLLSKTAAAARGHGMDVLRWLRAMHSDGQAAAGLVQEEPSNCFDWAEST
jgi:hypothetical protein